MKKILLFLLVAVMFSACSNGDQKTNEEGTSDSTELVVEEPVEGTDVETYTVTTFTDNAANLVDQQIKVTGLVDHICEHGGKKLMLVEDGSDHGVKVISDEKFEDSLAGTEVTVIGTVKVLSVDEEYCHNMDDEHKEQAQFFKDSMAAAGVDQLNFYSVEFISFE